jgi:hypothetical protein
MRIVVEASKQLVCDSWMKVKIIISKLLVGCGFVGLFSRVRQGQVPWS